MKTLKSTLISSLPSWSKIHTSTGQTFSQTMALFRSFVDGLSTVSNMVGANISPNKVTLVKPENYDSKTAIKSRQYLTLYKKLGCFECVFCNVAASPKYFSLFRLTKEVEANIQYEAYDAILSGLVKNTSSLCDEAKIQSACDVIREHPKWNCAHVAGFVGLFETFRDPDVRSVINSPDSVSGVSPLMSAVIGHQKHCVHEMLVQGAQVDMADFRGLTVYHYAVKHLPEVLDFLFDKDMHKTYDWMDAKGETALYQACLNPPERPKGEGLEKAVTVEMLLGGGADPAISKDNKLPIHVAVELGELECIRLIIQKHPDQKEAKDNMYRGTPLHWAKTRDVTELLCQLGCNVNALSGTNHTPLQVMLTHNRKEPLMELLCYGADCNIGDSNGDTPLHVAVQTDDIDLVRIFVVFGANVNLMNSTNQTPRHLAAISKGRNKDIILHMLHMSGAKRCKDTCKGCMVGCSPEGTFNGKPDEKSKNLFKLDKTALFDDMLCTAVSCTAKMKNSKGDAVLDFVDGPLDVGDRVLSLDGGGIRGLVLIQMLAAIEEAAGLPAHDLFDWVAGTSTGGLLALAIGVGKPTSYIRGMYFRLKDQVFKGSRPYDSIPFENLLKEEFGETSVMTDITHLKVVVTGVLADRFPAELHLFRSYQPTLDKPNEGVQGQNEQFEPVKPPHEQLIWKCARCSGAAPTYFRAFGQFMDGGMISNNPTLDLLTEIHEYNTGLKFRKWCAKQKQREECKSPDKNEADSVRPLGVVVSLGTGRVPLIKHNHIDVFKPSGILEVHKVYKGTTALLSLLIDQATVSEGRPVDRARAWCSMLNVPFFRFSPQLTEDIGLDCVDNQAIINMMWDTQCYIVANKHRIDQVAQLLKGAQGQIRVEGSSQQSGTSEFQDMTLHAAKS
ncbi:85/88 kDa calcium-independent phospholipase A2-like isoform X1 [Dreissena polymorpha]|uniref:85/88 kDa calcium-independent phospholipase A2-like isoform X1 n=1 Tax=Dreissena polymorpha TaxID=45954 RepID=UPI0022644466|nr:85/88 kDa calcium-independent phospholipase A2-like isoform X1 [Dreissena polymorpha]